MKNGKINLQALILKKSSRVLDKQESSFFYILNKQVLLLFGLILIICGFLDFYYEKSNLTTIYIITTFITAIIIFFNIPKLKEIKIKQIIRKEGPKNHFVKQGTPTMGGIFFIPIGIIISNILYFRNYDYKIILTLSVLIIFFMFIGLIDDLLSLKKKFNTGLTSNQKFTLQLFVSMIYIIFCV